MLPTPSRPGVELPEAGQLAARRRELGTFLRSRRERLTPEQVGLPATTRRRTPGLRREEVATLAGVGVTWYTWLEQAREVTPSVQVLDAVARTLLLDPHERAHLFTLAGAVAEDPVTAAPPISPEVELLLRQVEPFPASVTNARHDLLAYNTPFRFMVSDLDRIPPADRNSMWLIFTHPAWRDAVGDREQATLRLTGQFRAAMAEHLSEPAWTGLLHRLLDASPEFATIWARHDVIPTERFLKTTISPTAGVLRTQLTYLWLDVRQTQRVNLYTPADELTAQRLRTLPQLPR